MKGVLIGSIQLIGLLSIGLIFFFLIELGDYCDEKQKCISELKCDENKCLESSKCDGVDCGTVIRSCPENSYHVPRNGIDTCCDICKPYASK